MTADPQPTTPEPVTNEDNATNTGRSAEAPAEGSNDAPGRDTGSAVG